MTSIETPTDAQLAAAIERGIATGHIVDVDADFLARLAAALDMATDSYLARYGTVEKHGPDTCPVCATLAPEVVTRHFCTHRG